MRGSKSICRAAAALLLLGSARPLFADSPEGACARIVPLAPSLTEIAYELGLGDRVAGVSRFAAYPAEVRSKTSIGGLLDPNLEAVIALRPTSVWALREHREAASQLERLGILVERYNHDTVRGIKESIERIAARCGAAERGRALLETLGRAERDVTERVAGRPKVRALVLIGGKRDAEEIENLYVSGRDGFYAELLALAGGENVYRGQTGSVISLSGEGLVSLNPAAIIEIIFDFDQRPDLPPPDFRAAWKPYTVIDAVKNGRITMLDHYVDTVPGPRYPLVLRKIARALHPELAFDE